MDDILYSLKEIGYVGPLLQLGPLTDALTTGPKSDHYRQLAAWLAFEIHVLNKTDEKIGEDTNFNDFMLELSSFLKEITCPYKEFVEGPLTSRFQTPASRVLLINYLTGELMALKMYTQLKPTEESFVISMSESSTARALQTITKDLNLGKPNEKITPKALFDKIGSRLDEVIGKTNPKKLAQPLFKPTKSLTDIQWAKLEKIHTDLDNEYNLRRQMLLTRLEVTIQSFQWSERLKYREKEIMKRYQAKKDGLNVLESDQSTTDIPALLAARSDLAIIEKTSSANVRKNTSTKIQKHVIGKVPDRGGRAYEHAPPPPEMPSWQQNRSTGPAGGRGGGNMSGNRGGRGGGRGSSVQVWAQPAQGQFQQPQQSQQNQYQSGYNQRQQFDQKPPQYDDRDKWNSNSGGGNRVQGGWSQRGHDNLSDYNKDGGSYRGNNSYNNQSGNNYGGGSQNFNHGQTEYNRDGGNRGRGNYRGGRNRR